MSIRRGRASVQLMNSCAFPVGSGVSQFWPLVLQISFNINLALLVYGATKPIGSKTDASQLKMVRCVSGSSTGFLVPLLTTNMYRSWFHSRPKTCMDSFESTGGSTCYGSGKFPTNFVSLNPPFRSRQDISLLRCNDSFLDRQLSK